MNKLFEMVYMENKEQVDPLLHNFKQHFSFLE